MSEESVPITNQTGISYFDSALISQMEEYIDMHQYNMVLLELSNINKPSVKNAILDLIDIDVCRCIKDDDYENLDSILTIFRLYLRDQILSEVSIHVLSRGSFTKILMSGDLIDPPFKVDNLCFVNGDEKYDLLYKFPDRRIYDRASIVIASKKGKYYVMKCRGLSKSTVNQLVEGQYLYYKKCDMFGDLNNICDKVTHQRIIIEL